MPSFVAVAKHEGLGGDRLTYVAPIDAFETCLDSCAEKGVGRPADTHSMMRGQGEKRRSFLAGQGNRLFIVYALAGLDSLSRHGIMALGRRQVKYDVDFPILQHFFKRDHLRARILFGIGLGAVLIKIRAGFDPHVVE